MIENSPFYLKINSESEFSLRCFMHWVRICETLSSDIFVVCDKEQLKNTVTTLLSDNGYYKPCKFIESYRKQLRSACEDILSPNWFNAGSALLTPFVHAKEMGFSSFWNIDADDTIMFASPQVCAKILKKAEEYANEQQLDVFSLDMWYSQLCYWNIKHWSFGIVFTRMDADYFQIIERGKSLQKLLNYTLTHENIDDYFSFLREQQMLRAETFYCENLYFEHLKNYINTWKSGDLSYETEQPIRWLRKIDKVGVPIAYDAVKLDLGLSQNDSSLKIRDNILGEFALKYKNRTLSKVIVLKNATMQEVQEIFKNWNDGYPCLIVSDESYNFYGIITEKEINAFLVDNPKVDLVTVTVEAVYNKVPKYMITVSELQHHIERNTDPFESLPSSVRFMPIVENGKIVNIVLNSWGVI